MSKNKKIIYGDNSNTAINEDINPAVNNNFTFDSIDVTFDSTEDTFDYDN